MTDNRTVLVTGISGFIAKHCANDLLAKGYSVRGTVRDKARAQRALRTLTKLHPDAARRVTLVEADLTADAGWEDAVKGCSAVFHVASPFPLKQPKDPDALVGPARDGAIRVLQAAAKGGVRHAVMTSSTVAIIHGHPKNRTSPFTETDWTEPNNSEVSPYARSKTLAERAAWQFIDARRSSMTFTTINPGFVLGPALDGDIGTSLSVIQMFLQGKYPAVPKIHTPMVDVRDVSAAHVAALENPGAEGQRYLCAEASYWMADIGRALYAALSDRRKKIPTRELPNSLVRVMGLFDEALRPLVPDLGVEKRIINAKTVQLLGGPLRPSMAAAVASAESLMQHGLA